MHTSATPESSLYAVRAQLHELFMRSQIDLHDLSPFQRVVLTTDGTLTEILEAFVFEKIEVVKLYENVTYTTQPIAVLDLPPQSQVIKRRILLQGKRTQQNWLYAESVIVLDRLLPAFRDDLLKSRAPIGKLWVEYRVETFKEIVASQREVVGELADHFKVSAETEMLSRTYVVCSNRKPTMMITEKFPISYFR